jgi:hypothetical protein
VAFGALCFVGILRDSSQFRHREVKLKATLINIKPCPAG